VIKMAITLDTRQALQPKFMEGVINKKLEQQLDFVGMFPEVATNNLSFSWFKDTTNAGADITSGAMGTPNPLMEVTDLSTIEVSRIGMEHGAMQRFGYALEFSQRQLREPEFIDEVSRAVDRATFGMAKKMNDDVITAIQNNSNDVTEVSGAAVWSSASATPAEDILSFVAASRIEGYPYQMTDLFVHTTNYYEMLKYLQGVDIGWVRSPMVDGAEMPKVNGVTVHDLHSTQLSEGGYIGTDSRYPAMTIYKYLDPQHSSMDGRINVNKFVQERSPYNIVVELYSETGIALKLPNAAYYKSTGI
jgi:hypothetical protein